MKRNFQEGLAFGDEGEENIILRLKGRQWCVLPACDITATTGKGPRLFAYPRNLIVPDLLAMKPEERYWIECKRKARFVWFGITGQWRTGIEILLGLP